MLKVDARNRITKSLQEYRCLSHEVEVSNNIVVCSIMAMKKVKSICTK